MRARVWEPSKIFIHVSEHAHAITSCRSPSLRDTITANIVLSAVMRFTKMLVDDVRQFLVLEHLVFLESGIMFENMFSHLV